MCFGVDVYVVVDADVGDVVFVVGVGVVGDVVNVCVSLLLLYVLRILLVFCC